MEVSITESVFEHPKRATVHLNILEPGLNPETDDVGEAGFAATPEPEITFNTAIRNRNLVTTYRIGHYFYTHISGNSRNRSYKWSKYFSMAGEFTGMQQGRYRSAYIEPGRFSKCRPRPASL